jgi:hypothetical protein
MAAAADFELEDSIYSPGNPVQSALAVRHNGPEAVTTEVNDPAIRKAFAEVAGIKDFWMTNAVTLSVSGDNWKAAIDSEHALSFSHYTLKYPSREAKSMIPVRLQDEIKEYLRTRLIGHTREFALASLARKTSASVPAERSQALVLKEYKEIPASWLKPWEQEGKQVGYYVVDGELAWTFYILGGNFPWREVVDAQEFDPKLKDAFNGARKEAERNLAARGVKRQLGHCHAYWAEFKKVLRENYRIKWRCPSDLNLAVYD